MNLNGKALKGVILMLSKNLDVCSPQESAFIGRIIYAIPYKRGSL